MGGSPLNQYDQWSVQEERDHEETLDQLPSRKVTHPRPLSFLEKPAFSLILFILFIFVLCGILFSYLYETYQSNDEKKKPEVVEEQQDRSKLTGSPSQQAEPSESEPNVMQPSIPVVTIPTSPVEEDPQQEEKDEEEDITQNAQSVIHTVQEKENLYRIALKYYNNGSVEYREIIKKANGLTDDTIVKGMKLIIPSPNNRP